MELIFFEMAEGYLKVRRSGCVNKVNFKRATFVWNKDLCNASYKNTICIIEKQKIVTNCFSLYS